MNPFSFVKSVKKKYNITTTKDFILIVCVFSSAGMAVALSRRPIFAYLGLNHAKIWVQIIFIFLLIVPLYQLLTLIFGFMVGKFSFFWERQKVLGRFLKRAFLTCLNFLGFFD